MQLFYTLFSILALFLNKLNLELKIINSIFNFDLDKKKMALKYQSLRDFDSITIPSYNKNLIFSSRKSVKSNRKSSKVDIRGRKFIMSTKNVSSVFKLSKEKKLDDSQSSKIEIIRSKNSKEKSPDAINIKKINARRSVFKNENNGILNKVNLPKLNLPLLAINNNRDSNSNLKKFDEKIHFNLFDYFFRKKNLSIEKQIELYKLGINFYKKRMDLIHVFTLLLITEKILLKKNK